LAKFNAKTGKQVHAIDSKVLNIFMEYHWPGNVRELERVLEYAYIFVKGPVIFVNNLPSLDWLAQDDILNDSLDGSQKDNLRLGGHNIDGSKSERERICEALARADGRKARAACELGMSRTSLWRHMKALGLG
jgi:transcriptional regulator with PAS, ATPase and Fis domain